MKYKDIAVIHMDNGNVFIKGNKLLSNRHQLNGSFSSRRSVCEGEMISSG